MYRAKKYHLLLGKEDKILETTNKNINNNIVDKGEVVFAGSSVTFFL